MFDIKSLQTFYDFTVEYTFYVILESLPRKWRKLSKLYKMNIQKLAMIKLKYQQN